MNNDDLIERLKSILSLYTGGHKKAVEDAIAALSPVLPADVQKACDNLRAMRHMKVYADLIERLVRENAELKQEQLNGHNWELECEQLVHAEEVAELQARIEELEGEIEARNKLNPSKTKLRAKIAEYEKALKKLGNGKEYSGLKLRAIARDQLERIRGME